MSKHDIDRTIEALEARVRRIEARLRILRRAVAVAAALGATATLAAATSVAPDVLSARRFQLVGDDGAVVGRWANAAGGTRLEALDQRGRVVAGIELVGTKPYARIIAPDDHAGKAPVAAEKAPAHADNGAAAPKDGARKNEKEGEDDDAFDWVQ
jgi:hypothetical protein